MMIKFEYIVKNILKRELVVLWIFSIFAGLIIVVLQNKNELPLGRGDLVFLAILTLLMALYRPRWIFFLFIGSIAFENIILVSSFIPIQLRPYQFLGVILTAAVVILYVLKKLKFKILKPNWLDLTVFLLVPLGFLAILNSPEKNFNLKNNIILLSFIILYYLIRNFIRTLNDLTKTVFFFFGSFIVVTLYGFYQVFADKFRLKSFEVMFGRPNSTFTEPDWLGIYLCFALAVLLALIFYFLRTKEKFFISKKNIVTFLDILFFFNTVLIILTLSRSAWIGASAVIFFYLLIVLAGDKKNKRLDFKNFLREGVILIFIIFISFAAVYTGKLSKFDLIDRARSTTTSEQKITIACEDSRNIPSVIGDIGELLKYNCRHINLEEITFYKSQGKIVAEIFRKDPNVTTRGAIYQKSWKIIRQHPIIGVGFGTITQALGVDERGTGFNESNIFLQVWAGCGILGLMAFTGMLFYVFMHSFRKLSPVCPLERWLGCPIAKNENKKTLAVFTTLGILAILIPNFFNAGLFMGIFWFGLAIIISINEIYLH